jgi:hypothetical protein
MMYKEVCQSCSIPIDRPELRGTEKNGLASTLYCKYCYQDGSFTQPGITVTEMAASISERMRKEKMTEDQLRSAVQALASLKRWRKSQKKQKVESPVYEGGPSEKYPLKEPPPPGHLAEVEEDLDIVSGDDPEEGAPNDLKEY